MDNFIYKGKYLREISFPLGGIGTGCIGLAGNGRLIDWEIFNRPNKGSFNGFTHFAIKAEKKGKLRDARIIQSDLPPPYSGPFSGSRFRTFGFGPPTGSMAGIPHFRDVTFKGQFPVAKLDFRETKFPGKVSLTAFNPFIPLHVQDSSIPGAFFELSVKNTGSETLDYSIALSMKNPHEQDNFNKFKKTKEVKWIRFGSDQYTEMDVSYGDMTVATDAEQISYQENWFGGSWFDNLTNYWKEFTAPGRLKNRKSPAESESTQNIWNQKHATLAAHLKIKPGREEKVRFIITWNYPNCENYWNRPKKKSPKNLWKNYYTTLFQDSGKSAAYALKNWDRLYQDTLTFQKALFESTLPEEVIDAVSANISILKSPTVSVNSEGVFYGFEGCHCDSGCCEGSCTHVWNYAYALPFLFPSLERSMREAEYGYNFHKDGKMSFRLQLPLGRRASSFRACADGQFGGIIKVYREWKLSGDSEWMKKLWPCVSASLEYAWSASNPDKWDPDQKGILTGRQHHTLDMELFGPSSWLNSLYLAALKAAAEMAVFLGEEEKAKLYQDIFYKGKAWTEKHLFNGEYFHQKLNLATKSILEEFDAVPLYWNAEKKQIKYQLDQGCGVDQVLGQWHAFLTGLGEILDTKKVRSALRSIYRYNFKTMRDFVNPCRLFCLNDESGIVICTWPDGVEEPVIPVPYSQETMNGFEYQAASHMIREGMVRQGLTVVKAIRDRYDGYKRNPWNEFECGSNYARSMASYALLLAYSGFRYDLVKNHLGFAPILNKDGRFRCFWSIGTGYGTIDIRDNKTIIEVNDGYVKLKSLELKYLSKTPPQKVKIGKKGLSFENRRGLLKFGQSVELSGGKKLSISHRRSQGVKTKKKGVYRP